MARTDDIAWLRDIESRLRQLFIKGLEGHESSYHAFLSELSKLLRGFFRRRLRPQPQEVEDLVQEVLIAVHNARSTWRQGEPLTAWVYAIARYKLTDYFRSRARHEALNITLDEEQEIFSKSDIESAEARRDLSALLSELPERQQLPILHVKLQGLSVAEAAGITGMSESAVKVGIHRGLKTLAAKIRDGR